MSADEPDLVWANPSYRPLGWASLALLLVLAVSLVVQPRAPAWVAAVEGIVCAALGVAIWAAMVPVDLRLRGDQLIVRNPYCRPKTIAARDVARLEVAQRLAIHLKDGSRVGVWAVQATNLTLVRHTESYVDEVAWELGQALARSTRVEEP